MSNWIKSIKIYDSNGKDFTSSIENEINIQKLLGSKYDFVPKIISVQKANGYYLIEMENINEKCIGDKYGEEPDDIPKKYLIQMKNIIKKIFNEDKIEYIDITPYNFIESNGKIYLIDFEHAYITTSNNEKPNNWFLREILEDPSETIKFNPDFK